MSEEFPPRLHVLFARKSAKSLIIRRGPSDRVCTIGWDRKANTFKIGQWLHGRIYERRCDLSPDGHFFIYFAMNGRWGSEMKGSWSAISRYPYLKAVQLWAKGDCWNGGGLFTGQRKYWLNDGHGLHEAKKRSGQLQADTVYPGGEEYYGGECPGVYYLRLQRDGWTMTRYDEKDSLHRSMIFEKTVNEDWLLRKYCREEIHDEPGKGCYYDEHELVGRKGQETQAFPEWEWAEVEKHTIYWASTGKLYKGRAGVNGLNKQRELKDFHGMAFEAIAAPY